MTKVTPEQIDDLLPQTQCGLCGHGGCMPYAEAIVFEQAPINLCPPGGVNTLQALGRLLGQDSSPYIAEMEKKSKPPLLAVIREAECIGCTKCIQACPVDAIIGAAKQMHSIISTDCTGCELCVTPCPVDCIDMVEVVPHNDPSKPGYYRQRFQARNQRLSAEAAEKKNQQSQQSRSSKLNYIEAALLRAKVKKQSPGEG